MGWFGRLATSGSPDRELGSPTLATGVHDTTTMEQLCQRNFVCHQKPHPSNSFPSENTQSLLHVHIKTLYIVYNTMTSMYDNSG